MTADKINIGIELECLLSENFFPSMTLAWQNLQPIAPFWYAGTDGSISKWESAGSIPFFGMSTKAIDRRTKLTDEMRDWYFNAYSPHIIYKSIELTTGKANQSDGIGPITLDKIDEAIDNLAIYLGLEEEETWHHAIQINHSCGGHLHMSFEDKPLPVTAGVLNKAKIEYKQWLLKNKGEEALEIFNCFYHRGSYVSKTRAGEPLGTTRKEFCNNLGVEWRGFHFMKTENIGDFRARVKAGLNAFANAFELALTTKKVFFYKPFPEPKVEGIKEKIIKISQPFPMEIPCAI